MKKVKCIEEVKGYLTLNKIYDVIYISFDYNIISVTSDLGDLIYCSTFMFKLIEDEDTNIPTNPTHYHTKIQPIEFIEANNLGFHEGNVIKYITRYKDKNGIEDLEKAKTYIEMLIDKLKRENV